MMIFNNRAAVAAKVRAEVVDHLDILDDDYDEQADFEDDLGADSLDLVELVIKLEKTFEIQISDEQCVRLDTPGQVVDLICEILKIDECK